ncbi:MAG: monovalent cation/H(+) antiporter subunit G [Planctomycetota bacterium]|jgi:multicomponent Na+:H+ antiporter subunit G
MAWQEVLTAFFLVTGSLFMALGGLGMLRLPDLYLRMSASSKAATLGAALVMVAGAVHFGELDVATRALATVLFLFLTAPSAAHLIGRAGYIEGVAQYEQTVVDELVGQYCSDHHTLSSGSTDEVPSVESAGDEPES